MKITEVIRPKEATQVPVEDAIRVESGEKIRRVNMAKGCLYCGLEFPDSAEFCPECGRPREDAIRVESGVEISRTTMAQSCLYCGLQLPDTADFCPECGGLRERGFAIRPIQESEFDGLRKEVKGKDDLIRQQGFYYDGNGPLAHMEEYAHLGNGSKRGAPLAKRDRNTTDSLLIRELLPLC